MDREVNARLELGDDGRGQSHQPTHTGRNCLRGGDALGPFLSLHHRLEIALFRHIVTRRSARLKGELSSVRVITRVESAPIPVLGCAYPPVVFDAPGSIASRAE